MVKLQEAENQIVTDYEVYDHRPSDSDLLIGAVETHQACSDAFRTWWPLMLDSTPPRTRWRQKPRASSECAFPIAPPKAPNANANRRSVGFVTARSGAPDARAASAWSKRRHGLNRCRYKGEAGMKRLGRSRRHCRQRHQYWPRHGKKVTHVAQPQKMPLQRPPVTPAVFAMSNPIDPRSRKHQFCAGK